MKIYLSSCKGGLPLSIRKSKVIKNLANHQILSRYLTEKCFFTKLLVEFGSRSTKNVPPMALLPPAEGEKIQGWNGCFANYIDIFSGKTADKNRETRRTPQLKQLKKIQRKIFLDTYTITIPLIINTLIINKSFLKK